jgi:hypothetical protein
MPSGGLTVKDYLDFYLKMVQPNSGLAPGIIPAFLDEIAQIMNDKCDSLQLLLQLLLLLLLL